jgi:LemA protein
VLRPDEPIYLLGDATLRTDTVALEFAPDDPAAAVRRSLLVSAGDERRVARRTGWQGLGLLLLLVAGAAGLPAAWHGVTTARDGDPLAGDPSTIEATRGAMTVAAALVLAALPVLYVGRLFNRLVAARNRVEAAWSLIDVQLRKRHDLIPRLVAVVEAAAVHERTLLESVTALRSGASLPDATRLPDADLLEQVAELDEAERTRSRSLIALAEAYPELRTNENFIALGEQIIAVENGVAFARTFYNDALTVMRDQRQRFPGLLLAPLVPVPPMGLFESDQPDARPAETAEAPADIGES